MKNLILTIGIVFTTLLSFAQSGQSITVTVDNVQSTKGKVSFALHTADTFMKGNGLMAAESKIEGNIVTVTFENVPSGEYAILALHDTNGNNGMDYRENGMPLESFGASNNVMNFGPPQYEDAKFTLSDKDLTLNIKF